MKFVMKLIILVLFHLVYAQDFKPCNHDDDTCLNGLANNFWNTRYMGDPQIGLDPLDPLLIKNVSVVQGSSNRDPLYLIMKFKNIKAYGLRYTTNYKFQGFKSDPEGMKVEMRFRVPKISLIGPYEADGRILLLPFQGKGEANITIIEPDFKINFLFKKESKNGMIFAQAHKAKLDFELKRVYSTYTNLFNGNKLLSDNMHQFFDENWEDIFKTVKPAVKEGFSRVFQDVCNHFMEKIPYNAIII